LNSLFEISKKWRLHYDIGYHNERLAIICQLPLCLSGRTFAFFIKSESHLPKSRAGRDLVLIFINAERNIQKLITNIDSRPNMPGDFNTFE
jgi:hypothetical protein